MTEQYGLTATAALAAIQEKERERIELSSLAAAQQRFVERWAPQEENPYDRRQFEADLNYLVHLIYREAQVPLVKQLTEFMMKQNNPAYWIIPERSAEK